MAENYIGLHLDTEDEIVIALLSQYSFESFEERAGQTIAYISQAQYETEKTDVLAILNDRKVTFEEEVIVPQNWNATWEASFQPVVVDDFCVVRADFHEPIAGIKYEILIDPKMAFGTGHHETTYMMMKSMKDIDFTDKNVFDFGCGTGILSVLASKLGAKNIDAIDIEQASYENTLENAALNTIQNINAAQSTLETFDVSKYDIILANINRGVLLDSASKLYDLTMENGVVLLSGLLEDDIPIVRSTYENVGFKYDSHQQKGDWICMKMWK